MKKIGILLFVSVFMVGCSSNQSKEEMFSDAAKACNNICDANPSVSQVSSSAGGGLPLLFIGGMETSCQCVR
ncbi:MAG: hypothetical protein ACJA2D_001971 [Pseudohongiellaceae bacterium]|jgi:uncharacterized protein YcfL